MLKSLSITNFRCFPKYHMPGLARVNLLVGRNNSGKTAVLEALHFLASDGAIACLESAARRRGEVLQPNTPPFRTPLADLSHIYPGHQIASDQSIVFEDKETKASVRLTIGAIAQNTFQQMMLFESELGESGEQSSLALHVFLDDSSNPKNSFLLSTGGRLLSSQSARFGLFGSDSADVQPNVLLVPASSFTTETLSSAWDRVIEHRQEKRIVDALRLLDPTVEDIVIRSDRRYGVEKFGVVIGSKNQPKRVPIGSLGDGMWRVLSLACALTYCGGGSLLVDEIDSGLHYSVMQDMWSLIVQTAIERNVQVFATTHSNDCLQALSSLCESKPELAVEVAVHKLNAGFESSVPISGPELPSILYGGAEIR